MESRDTGKSRTSGSGRRLAETAWNTNRKAEHSPYAPPPYFHPGRPHPTLDENERTHKLGNALSGIESPLRDPLCPEGQTELP
jgi:hypothetical protein